jgi:hypothetical protein
VEPELRQFFTGDSVRRCDEFQKAMYFFFLAYNINSLFDNTPETNDLARTAM